MAAAPPNEIHQLHLHQLATFIRESGQILADWDTYSDEHCDPYGWPLDEYAYGLRSRRRDADTWRSFNRVRHCAKDLLTAAKDQGRRLPASRFQPQWTWALSDLGTALDEIDAHQAQWLTVRAALPLTARPGTEEYDEPLAERNTEAWQSLATWVLYGRAVLDIHAAAHQPLRRPPAPARAKAAPFAVPRPSVARR
ncbi:hypothetical protein ABZ769_34330 [Streptomyces olivoreticuli]